MEMSGDGAFMLNYSAKNSMTKKALPHMESKTIEKSLKLFYHRFRQVPVFSLKSCIQMYKQC